MKKTPLVSFVVLFSVIVSRGQVINGSLEDTLGTFVPGAYNYMELPAGSTALPGWTVVSDSISWLPNGNPWDLVTPFGSMFLDLTGNHDNGSYGGISQVIATSPSQVYRLSLSLGSQQDQPEFNGPMSVLVTAGAASQIFTLNPAGSGNQWGAFSFDFMASSGSTLLTLVGTGSNGGSYLGLDNVQVVAVPEASAVSMLSWGTTIFIVIRRKPAWAQRRGYRCERSTSLPHHSAATAGGCAWAMASGAIRTSPEELQFPAAFRRRRFHVGELGCCGRSSDIF